MKKATKISTIGLGLALGLLWCNLSFAEVATHMFGKGPLKLSKNTADVVEYYFSGGKRGVHAKEQKEAWKPALIAISPDGDGFALFRHPLSVTHVDKKNYTLKVISNCKKRFKKKECYIFANAYKIVWDNGSDKKRRKLKYKEIRQGKTLQILQELGFYDPVVQKPKKIEKKKAEKKKKTKNTKTSDNNLTQQLKELNELYKSGSLTKEEFEKAKKKLLN